LYVWRKNRHFGGDFDVWLLIATLSNYFSSNFGVKGSDFGAKGSNFRVKGSDFGVRSSDFGVQRWLFCRWFVVRGSWQEFYSSLTVYPSIFKDRKSRIYYTINYG
jgi:hypothetical protein